MKLIIGLGNIGPHFKGSRHNLGFSVVDELAARANLDWLEKSRLKAALAQGSYHDQPLTLAKPTTYYNLAGEAARAIKDFYKLDNSDILVIHDELDLPFGVIRARVG